MTERGTSCLRPPDRQAAANTAKPATSSSSQMQISALGQSSERCGGGNDFRPITAPHTEQQEMEMTCKTSTATIERLTETDKAFKQLAAKIQRYSECLDRMGEEGMGLLTYRLAGKFHRASNELRELNHTLQQVVSEMDQKWPAGLASHRPCHQLSTQAREDTGGVVDGPLRSLIPITTQFARCWCAHMKSCCAIFPAAGLSKK